MEISKPVGSTALNTVIVDEIDFDKVDLAEDQALVDQAKDFCEQIDDASDEGFKLMEDHSSADSDAADSIIEKLQGLSTQIRGLTVKLLALCESAEASPTTKSDDSASELDDAIHEFKTNVKSAGTGAKIGVAADVVEDAAVTAHKQIASFQKKMFAESQQATSSTIIGGKVGGASDAPQNGGLLNELMNSGEMKGNIMLMVLAVFLAVADVRAGSVEAFTKVMASNTAESKGLNNALNVIQDVLGILPYKDSNGTEYTRVDQLLFLAFRTDGLADQKLKDALGSMKQAFEKLDPNFNPLSAPSINNAMGKYLSQINGYLEHIGTDPMAVSADSGGNYSLSSAVVSGMSAKIQSGITTGNNNAQSLSLKVQTAQQMYTQAMDAAKSGKDMIAQMASLWR